MNFINGNIYRIKNQYYPNHALNVYGTNAASTGRNVCLYDDTPSDKMQRWVLKTCGDGFQLCSAVNNSYVLDCSNGSLTNSYKNNAHLYDAGSSNTANSKVKFIEVSDDLYKIYLPGKNLYLTATNINRLNGLPASTIKTATALTGGTGGQSNVYWAAAATSDIAIQKQCWTIEKYSGSSSGGGTYQKLIMPINQSVITVCYKENAPAYHEQGFSDPMHYAIDMTGTPRSFYASGDGTIVGYSATNSGPLGKWLAVRYDKVEGVDGKKYDGLVLRYCHLDDIYKTSGEVHINDEDAMARYGKTGTKSAHLHVEVDTDTVNYNKTPTIKGNSNGLVPAGNDDTTIDPFLVFHKKISEPENQSVSWSQSYCDKDNCSICAQYTQYEPGKVPYVNIEQCRNVPEIS